MSKPSAFPSLVTCLFGPSRREQPENRANPLVCSTAQGGYSTLKAPTQSEANNGKRPVARATSHQPQLNAWAGDARSMLTSARL
ncbi:hypothetical protein PLUA15_530157 [Pseudomonas lundensis]|uniref:Uncharacterized protein n=1 Tax=Pseudomonas lundensis TaxID=86185 RepID=A0AAX2HCS8_9PSED|nr:hypothetical protein PLUA15_530157 [Pseudomonas lundensis]